MRIDWFSALHPGLLLAWSTGSSLSSSCTTGQCHGLDTSRSTGQPSIGDIDCAVGPGNGQSEAEGAGSDNHAGRATCVKRRCARHESCWSSQQGQKLDIRSAYTVGRAQDMLLYHFHVPEDLSPEPDYSSELQMHFAGCRQSKARLSPLMIISVS